MAAGIGTAIAVIAEDPMMGLLSVPIAGIVLAVLILIRMPDAWTKEAGPDVIGAAFCTATTSERPHLMAALQARLGNPSIRTPIDGLELVRMFEEVRQKHGAHARLQAECDRRMLARQQRLLMD